MPQHTQTPRPTPPMSHYRTFRLALGGLSMRDRLRLTNMNLAPRGTTPKRTAQEGVGSLRFPGTDTTPDTLPTSAPMHAWRPHGAFDSIENAESALDHAEKQMANLRALLGMEPQDPDAPNTPGPRAA